MRNSDNIENHERMISSTEAAALCGVSRGTINYWIQNKKLYANRSGRNYSIPVKELILFLKSTRREIPLALKINEFRGPIFRNLQHCWEYWKGSDHGDKCTRCVVFTNNLEVCFSSKKSMRFQCDTTCTECQYYLEIIRPRIQILQQIDFPAAIYKDLYFWSGNKKFAEMCEVREKDMPGMGIEQIIHPDSLPRVISNMRNNVLAESKVPRSYSIFINNKKYGKLKVQIAFYPFKEPPGTNLILAEPEDD